MGSKKTYDALYLRSYRKHNPEKAEQWRITSEIRHLERLGYKVIPPKKKQPEEMTLDELESHFDKARQAQREYKRQWREKNRERVREYNREYKRTHQNTSTTEETKKYIRRWREKNPERVRDYQRRWLANHPEKVREYNKRWRDNHPNYGKIRYERYKKALEQAKRDQRAKERDTK